MKSLREQFEEDYEAVPYVAQPGGKVKIRYVYDGPWYIWDIPENLLKSKKQKLTGLSLISLVLFIGTALIPAGLNTWSLTAIAGIFSLAAHVLELFGVIRFLIVPYQTTRMDYNYINGLLRIVPWIRGICLLAAGVCGIFYMAGNTFTLPGLAAFAGYLAGAVLAFVLAVQYKNIPFTTKKNESRE